MRLVTRGDDMGGSHAANRAIAAALRAGGLRNVSVMAPGLAIEEGAKMLLELDGGFDVGLHVCLNAEWATVKWGPVLPAEQVPSLVEPDGSFTWAPIVLHERGFVLEEAIREVEAQLARLRALGLDVAYVDQHMGVGWIGGLGAEISALCKLEGLIDASAVSVQGFHLGEGDRLEDRFLAALEAGGPTALYVTHPAEDSDETRAYWHEGLEPGVVAREREAERRLWVSPELREAVDSGLLEPLRYSEVSATS